MSSLLARVKALLGRAAPSARGDTGPPAPALPPPPPEGVAIGPAHDGYVFLVALPRIHSFCRARLDEESGPGGTRAETEELRRQLGEAVHTLRANVPLYPGGLSVHEAEGRVRAIVDRYRDHPGYPSLWRPDAPPRPGP
ncbi:hypothetical protein GCM10010415_64490 [Streptomyces atrovirens]|uniref:Uncharacterized protein n=1 Tax=Streptomyces atrovirens TaxID=285556 RepID=A0ABW0DL41_9ACTN